jgi:hypothetical protein
VVREMDDITFGAVGKTVKRVTNFSGRVERTGIKPTENQETFFI